MRSIQFLVTISLGTYVLSSCSNSSASNSGFQDTSTEVVSRCDTTVVVGTMQLCLPMVAGMVEASRHPLIASSPGLRVTEASHLLAFYMPHKYSAHPELMEAEGLDDYCKVYSMRAFDDIDFDQAMLDRLATEMTKNIMRRDWSSIETDLEKAFEGVSFGQPVLADYYKPRKGVSTLIYLAPIVVGEEYEGHLLSALSLCLVNKRLVYVVHYLKYTGVDCVGKLKARSDYYSLSLLDANV